MPRGRKKVEIVEPISSPPIISPDMKELQLVSLATELAEKQLREGTASAMVITHFLKLATKREQAEREKLEKEVELLSAKTEAIQSTQRMEELYLDAIKAMKHYSGGEQADLYDEDL